jgi:FMN phosphatase YigB (HAD superfamily)
MLKGGVLFVGEKNGKGEVLLLLLEKLNYRPENVVFVDDRLRHLIGVEKALKSIGVPYKGFRYGGADEKVKAFVDFTTEVSDQETAEIFYMGKLI